MSMTSSDYKRCFSNVKAKSIRMGDRILCYDRQNKNQITEATVNSILVHGPWLTFLHDIDPIGTTCHKDDVIIRLKEGVRWIKPKVPESEQLQIQELLQSPPVKADTSDITSSIRRRKVNESSRH